MSLMFLNMVPGTVMWLFAALAVASGCLHQTMCNVPCTRHPLCKVALNNYGPPSIPNLPLRTPPVQAAAASAKIPPASTINSIASCEKTVLNHNQLVCAPIVAKYLHTVIKPVLETVTFEHKPICSYLPSARTSVCVQPLRTTCVPHCEDVGAQRTAFDCTPPAEASVNLSPTLHVQPPPPINLPPPPPVCLPSPPPIFMPSPTPVCSPSPPSLCLTPPRQTCLAPPPPICLPPPQPVCSPLPSAVCLPPPPTIFFPPPASVSSLPSPTVCLPQPALICASSTHPANCLLHPSFKCMTKAHVICKPICQCNNCLTIKNRIRLPSSPPALYNNLNVNKSL